MKSVTMLLSGQESETLVILLEESCIFEALPGPEGQLDRWKSKERNTFQFRSAAHFCSTLIHYNDPEE